MSTSGVLLFTVLLMGYIFWSLAQPTNILQIRCKMTPAVLDPQLCKYGSHISYCKKLACKQGPGQPCGNDRDLKVKYGECAEGLDCCNGKCQGCYMDECHGDSCNPMVMNQFIKRHYRASSPADSLYAGVIFDYFNH
ncbi:neuroparsin-A-like [Anopheles darlingi]|uniref:neuroparsin-A-like n=1 Tax=Anopheles darlingi TaxID=43151 RepID=UPI0021004860|nr:neuroparsin-A-like [Anopheles darlingi]